MKIKHYDQNGKLTGYSEQTTVLEWLCGFAFGGVLALVGIPTALF